MVPHRGTNWAALRLTAQIGRDAVLSKSYGRGCQYYFQSSITEFFHRMNIDERRSVLLVYQPEEELQIRSVS